MKFSLKTTKFVSKTRNFVLKMIFSAGKKLGLRLYDTAEAFAKACGYTTIWLESVARFTSYRHRIHHF